MALPTNIERVTLKFGPYWDGQGNPIRATLEAKRSVTLTHIATGGLVLPTTEKTATDGATEGQLAVVASNPTGITPQNFTYDLTIAFDAAVGVAPIVRRGVALPKGAPNVDVDLLVNGTPSDGQEAWGPAVLSVNGQTGIVTIATGGGTGSDPGASGPSLPGGGTAGQVLTKNSVLDADALWRDPAVTAVQISDATTTGRNILKAATQAAALTAIGAAAASHNHTAAQVTDLSTAVDARIALRVGAAPATLDTLDELANALGDDPNFATTMTTQLGLRAPKANPAFTGIVTVNDQPLPANPVGSDNPVTLITDPSVDPSTLDPDEIAVLDSNDVLVKPAANPTTESVPTVTTTGVQRYVPLSSLGSASSGSAPTGPAVTARAVLAAMGAQGMARDTFAVHPNPPVVSLALSSGVSTIPNALRVPLRKRTSTLIDVLNDPHWDYPGVRPDQLAVHSTQYGYANLLTGGSSQARRDAWRLRTIHSGQYIEFFVQPAGTSLRYRLTVDGIPLTSDQVVVATVTAGVTYYLKLDFGTANVGPRVIELEVTDPRLGGAWIGLTDTVQRWRAPQFKLLGFGDSHTSSAAGVGNTNTWIRWAARQLSMDHINSGIGGTGYLTDPVARFRTRLQPDVVTMNPDVVVFFGGYNDVATTSTAAQVQAEAEACYAELKASLPNAVIIVAGPLQQGSNVPSSMLDIDGALRNAAATAGLPYISFCDLPGNARLMPAWAPSTSYSIGDVKSFGGVGWVATTTHTSGATFAADQATKWRSLTFNTGTGNSGAPTGDGNADVNVATDGIHSTQQGHKNLGFFLASEISRILRSVAA